MPGSGCTSLGKYKIGGAYQGQFGLAYKLYGLDSTNSNAYQRNVVLHAYDRVPDNEVYKEICQSSGCRFSLVIDKDLMQRNLIPNSWISLLPATFNNFNQFMLSNGSTNFFQSPKVGKVIVEPLENISEDEYKKNRDERKP